MRKGTLLVVYSNNNYTQRFLRGPRGDEAEEDATAEEVILVFLLILLVAVFVICR